MSRSTSPARSSLSIATQVGLLAGPFLSMVDSSVVNVAVPDISRDLHTTLSSAQWVLSVYLLALAVVLAATAYLLKRFGTHRVYLMRLVGFTAASLAKDFCSMLRKLDGDRLDEWMLSVESSGIQQLRRFVRSGL